MIDYSSNWMGPLRKDWINKNGDGWVGGRIDMRGESLDPYGDEVAVPIIDVESWRLLSEWLYTYETEHPDYDVLNTFQQETGRTIIFWKKEVE